MRSDLPTFRAEEDRMDFLFHALEGKAQQILQTRFDSVDYPFSGLAEMVQKLESAYGNPNEFSEARDRLSRLHYFVHSA
ncbi:hypothetical protein CP532_6650 [Ophiocordyceps camponoti-leonardi (nom. inval.)]|nr:hypothetical protein CP532_6650 [Ophiocordyceps camponoti-leonardi (nom. inval.)]